MTRHIGTVEAAKMVRKLLKANYPGTKFSVTSKSGMRVVWSDGPSKAQVKHLLAPFTGSQYDGQWERTHYSHSWILADGSVVFAQKDAPVPEGAEEVCFGRSPSLIRKHSKALIEAAAIAGKEKYGWDAPAIQGYDGDYSFVLDLTTQEPLHRWFTEVLEAMTEYPEEQEAAEAALVDPEPTPEPEPKALDIGPRPIEKTPALHWMGKHVAHLMGADWTYTGNPEWSNCDILHVDGYGIHFYMNNKPKVKVSGKWPRLTDDFHRGGYLFDPADQDKPTMNFSLDREPAAVLRDIERRFLPQYLKLYPERMIACETIKRRGIKRLELLKKFQEDVGGYRDETFRTDRVHLKHNGHTFATVTVDTHSRTDATDITLPVGREVATMQAIKHLHRSTNECPALAQLEDDQGVIKAALAILQGCIPEKYRSQALTNAVEELEDAWDLLQDGIGLLQGGEEPSMIRHGKVLLAAD